MNFHFNIVIAVSTLLALYSSAASQISLTVDPSVILEGLTDTLTLRCSVRTQETNSTKALEGSRVSNTSFNIEHVDSIIVWRGSPNNEVTIARIIGPNLAEAITDEDKLQVKGVLNPGVPSGSNFLELEWTNPRQEQNGEYRCRIDVQDTLGRGSVLEAKADVVKVKTPGIQALITEMINFKSQIDTQKKRINEMKSVLKAPHTEYGEVRCLLHSEGKRHMTKYVHFTTPYTDIPVVSVGVISVDVDRGSNARYYIRVTEVSKTGFKFLCGTWSDSVVYLLDASWTSTLA